MASKKIGALWFRKSQNGLEYYSGVLDFLGEDIQISVFSNDKKEKDNQPDFNIVRSGQQEEKQTSSSKFIKKSDGATEQVEEVDIEDIPF